MERSNRCFTVKPERDIFSNRMPPVVGVNVVFEGQRCADELILGMSRRAWRQRARVHCWGGGVGGALENGPVQGGSWLLVPSSTRPDESELWPQGDHDYVKCFTRLKKHTHTHTTRQCVTKR